MKKEDYDRILEKQIGKYSQGNYLFRNSLFASMINKYSPKRVFEFAGAEGQLADFILKSTESVEFYLWSDFSDVSIDYSTKVLSKYKNCSIVDLDMNHDLKKINWGTFDCVISTALEHIEKDLEIMKRINENSLVCLALPNFNAVGHIRYFPSFQDVLNRYGSYLNILEYRILGHDVKNDLRPIIFIKHILYKMGILKYFQKFILKTPYPSKRYLIIAQKKVV